MTHPARADLLRVLDEALDDVAYSSGAGYIAVDGTLYLDPAVDRIIAGLAALGWGIVPTLPKP